MKKLFFACLFACIAVAAMAEKQTVVLHLPEMECNNCKAKVEKVLAYERGMKALDFELEKRTVKITFEDKRTSVEKLQKALAKYIKYKSTVVGAKQEKKACSESRSCCGR